MYHLPLPRRDFRSSSDGFSANDTHSVTAGKISWNIDAARHEDVPTEIYGTQLCVCADRINSIIIDPQKNLW